MTHKYPVNWFEIPATNFERAVKFYSTIFDKELPTTHMNGADMAFFSTEPLGSFILKYPLVAIYMSFAFLLYYTR